MLLTLNFWSLFLFFLNLNRILLLLVLLILIVFRRKILCFINNDSLLFISSLLWFLFIWMLEFLCHSFEGLKLFETWTLSILFDKDRFSFWFENTHKSLYLSDCTFFWFVFIHIWKRLQNSLDVVHFLIH